MKRIIFVCSGNICRSPMAEVIARRAFAEAGIPAHIISMGTLGIFGRPASDTAVAVCAQAGLDLSSHSSQGISFGILDKADVVVVMERAHRDFIFSRRPELTNVRMLSSVLGGAEEDVPDPIGRNRGDYEACFARLRQGVADLVRGFELGLY